MLCVSDGSTLSLAQIEEIWSRGVSVLRSAHIGNLNAQTLFLAAEGYPVVLDEFALGTMAHYRPAFVRSSGREVQVATIPHLPASHLATRHPAGEDRAGSQRGPAAVHFAALTRLFPSSVRLTAAVLREQLSFVTTIVEVLAEHHPQSFRKLIDGEGRVFMRAEPAGRPEGHLYVAADGAQRTLRSGDLAPLMLETIERAAAIPERDYSGDALVLDVDTDILLLTISEVYRGREGRDRFRPDGVTAMHFSGLEMMNYLLKSPTEAARHQCRLTETYALLMRHLPGRLPRRIDLCVVPTAALAHYLATNAADLQVLEANLAAHDDLAELDATRRTLWSRAAAPSEDELAAASLEDVAAQVRHLDVTALPSHFRRQVRRAQATLITGTPDRRALLAVLVKSLMFAEGRYPDLAENRERAVELRQHLALAGPVAVPEVTQYDMLAGTRLLFAERARGLTQDELRLRWRQTRRT